MNIQYVTPNIIVEDEVKLFHEFRIYAQRVALNMERLCMNDQDLLF